MSTINMEMLLILKILKLLMCLSTVYGNFVDHTENTELIQQRAGYDVKLQCDLKGLIDERKLAEIKIHWYFKQCHDNNCYQFVENDWTALPCEQNFCKSELWLHNVTEKYSGLYKCTVYPYRFDSEHTLDIQLVRTYQLDVKNSSLAVPEFLDAYPSNKSVTVDTQVVFQCRVHSEEHPTIKWFRRLPPTNLAVNHMTTGSENLSPHIVRYNGRTYELLKTASEKMVSDQVYLSKLILYGVRLRDEGYYACAAISYRGHKIREAYLQVMPSEETEYWADYDDELSGQTDPKEFLLLFLMPLGWAMLPLTVWLCYLCYKRCIGTQERQHSDEEGMLGLKRGERRFV